MKGAQQFLLNRHFSRAHELAQKYAPGVIKEPMHTMIIGSEGIGKTCFGLVLLSDLLRLGRVVTLEVKQLKYLLISPAAWEDQTKYRLPDGGEETNRETLEELLSQDASAPLGPGVWSFIDTPSLYIECSQVPHFVNFIDFGFGVDSQTDGPVVDVQTSPVVIVTSPNSGRLKRFREWNIPFDLEVMTPWDEDEIVKLNEELQTPEHAESFAKPKDALELKKRFNLYGGIPREIFHSRPFDQAILETEKTISRLDFRRWFQVLTTTEVEALPWFFPGTCVHVFRDQKSPRPPRVRLRFASRFMASLVFEHFNEQQRKELLSLSNSVFFGNAVLAELRRVALEHRAHDEFVKGLQTNELIRLDWENAKPSTANESDKVPVNFSTLKRHFFYEMDMSDLTEFKQGRYYQPRMSDFPGVDGLFLGDIEGHLVAFGIHNTVSSWYGSKYPADHQPAGPTGGAAEKLPLRTTLTRIRDHLRKVTGIHDLPLYVIFVTTPNGINRAQNLGQTFRESDLEFQQFALRVNWFDDLLKEWSLSEPTAAEQEASISIDLEDAKKDKDSIAVIETQSN